MRELNFDWCFEGGCSHVEDVTPCKPELDTTELEAMYREPCRAFSD